MGAKNKNLAGRSGIGMLVVGFSWIGAVKKHAPFIFSSVYAEANQIFDYKEIMPAL